MRKLAEFAPSLPEALRMRLATYLRDYYQGGGFKQLLKMAADAPQETKERFARYAVDANQNVNTGSYTRFENLKKVMDLGLEGDATWLRLVDATRDRLITGSQQRALLVRIGDETRSDVVWKAVVRRIEDIIDETKSGSLPYKGATPAEMRKAAARDLLPVAPDKYKPALQQIFDRPV